MAIVFNDNFRINAGKPVDLKFGPYLSISDANDAIPLATRYNGLIFGVYDDPSDIPNSDITYYCYYGSFTNSEIRELIITKQLSGTANFISKFLTENSIGNSIIYEDDNKIGFNTISPTNTVDINGDLRIRTLNNLNNTPTHVITPDSNGLLTTRTINELKDDLGVITIPMPDGVVNIGSVTQNTNDITYDTDWVWRLGNVEYSPSNPINIEFSSVSAGFIRRDLIVGDNSGNIIRIEGNSVEDTEPAIAPNPSPNTVALQDVLITDTGIDSFNNFALSTFVRFDINDQNLNEQQRQNARTNIEAVRRDGPDTIQIRKPGEGGTRFWRFVDNNGLENLRISQTGQGSETLVTFEMRNQAGNRTVRLLNGVPQTGLGSNSPTFHLRASGTGTRTLVTWADGNNDPLFSMIASGSSRFFNYAPLQPRSNFFERSVRRDELPLLYNQINNESGRVDNLELNPDAKSLVVGSNVTHISGINADGSSRVLYISTDNPNGLILNAQDTNSSTNNRFYNNIIVPHRTYIPLIYNTQLNRWLSISLPEIEEFLINAQNGLSVDGKNTVVLGGDIDRTTEIRIPKPVTFPSNGIETFYNTTTGPWSGPEERFIYDVIYTGIDLYVAGAFDEIDGISRDKIAKVNLLDLSIDTEFVPDSNDLRINSASSIALQGDKILFIEGNVNIYTVKRMNSDGFIDNTFNDYTHTDNNFISDPNIKIKLYNNRIYLIIANTVHILEQDGILINSNSFSFESVKDIHVYSEDEILISHFEADFSTDTYGYVLDKYDSQFNKISSFNSLRILYYQDEWTTLYKSIEKIKVLANGEIYIILQNTNLSNINGVDVTNSIVMRIDSQGNYIDSVEFNETLNLITPSSGYSNNGDKAVVINNTLYFGAYENNQIRLYKITNSIPTLIGTSTSTDGEIHKIIKQGKGIIIAGKIRNYNGINENKSLLFLDDNGVATTNGHLDLIATFNDEIGLGWKYDYSNFFEDHTFIDKKYLEERIGGFNLQHNHILVGDNQDSTQQLEIPSNSVIGRDQFSDIIAIPSEQEWVNPVPATPNSPGLQGQKAVDDNYIYFCANVNTWFRVLRDATWNPE